MTRLFFCYTIILLLTHSSFAQNFGGHPSKIKWMQLDGPHVRLIYPLGQETRARHISSVIETLQEEHTYSIGNRLKKADIVLQTNQVVSNGFARLAPYRSELFGTGLQSSQQLGTTSWLDLLAIHEYRHLQQYNNGRHGATKVMSILGGQTWWALAQGLSIPDWYYEGDAVVAETVFTKSGRGRLPSFFKEQRAILMSGLNYDYMVYRNGSLQKLLPDHYRLGFIICNYTRNHYGPEVWPKILADAGRYKPVFYPFSGAMKRYTGLTTTDMYHAAYNDLKTKWEQELDQLVLKPTTTLTPTDSKTVTNYRFPHLMDDGSIIAIKNSFKKINKIVKIKDGHESQVCDYSITADIFLSENNGILAWTELQMDGRRGNRNFSRIITYDLKSNERRTVISKSKYFSPQVSMDGSRIVVVEANELLENKILILDAGSGEVLQSISNPENAFLSYPQWTKDDASITYIENQDGHLALMKYDLDSQHKTQLCDWTSHAIGAYDLSDDYLICSASFTGIDNIYALSLDGSRRVIPLSSVKIGAYEPTVSSDSKSVVMGETTVQGQILSEMQCNLSLNQQERFHILEPADMPRFDIQTNEYEHFTLDNIKEVDLEAKPYKGIFKGMQLHSWGFTDFSRSFNLAVDNTLADISANFGIAYNSNEETTNYVGSISYSKLFPVLNLSAGRRNRSTEYAFDNTIRGDKFNENFVSATASIPLNWIKGQYFYGINPSMRYSYTNTFDYENVDINRADFNFSALRPQFSFYLQQATARQNIGPKFGINGFVQYHTSLDNSISADKWNLSTTLSLPGFFVNHSFRISSAYQKELLTNEYQYPDGFRYSRGYDDFPNDETSRFSFDYGLPLAYPDWGFAGLVYFRRLRANLFYDYGQNKIGLSTLKQRSYGGELLFDINIFNVQPISIGIRQSFLQDTDLFNPNRNNRFELLFTF